MGHSVYWKIISLKAHAKTVFTNQFVWLSYFEISRTFKRVIGNSRCLCYKTVFLYLIHLHKPLVKVPLCSWISLYIIFHLDLVSCLMITLPHCRSDCGYNMALLFSILFCVMVLTAFCVSRFCPADLPSSVLDHRDQHECLELRHNNNVPAILRCYAKSETDERFRRCFEQIIGWGESLGYNEMTLGIELQNWSPYLTWSSVGKKLLSSCFDIIQQTVVMLNVSLKS